MSGVQRRAASGSQPSGVPLPPVAQLVLPCAIGAIMLTLGVVELSIDLSGNEALLEMWYSTAESLPLLSQWNRFVLPFLLLLLIIKLTVGA